MPDLLFVDVQDRSGSNVTRIKRHVATNLRRKQRLYDVSRYQSERKLRILAPQSSSASSSSWDDSHSEWDDLEKILSKSERQHLHNGNPGDHRGGHLEARRARVMRRRIAPPQPIAPPGDDGKLELIVNQSIFWMTAQYERNWSREDATFFDLNNQVEILRESFYVVSDLLTLHRVDAAFQVLNHALNAIPYLLKHPHPETLMTLMEIASGINLCGAPAIHNKVKAHLAQLTAAILGPKHPHTVLFSTQLTNAPYEYVTELVLKCIIEVMSQKFGSTAYQTLVQQFGRSQFYSRTGRSAEALKMISTVHEYWSELYGPNSILATHANLEYRLQKLKLSDEPKAVLGAQANNAALRVEGMSGLFGTKFTEKPLEQLEQFDDSPVTRLLAQWFMMNKRYCFSLHNFRKPKFGSTSDRIFETPPGSPPPHGALADLISNVAHQALSELLCEEQNLVVLPSQKTTWDEDLTPLS